MAEEEEERSMGGVPRRRLIGTGGGTATKWSGDARRSMKGEEDEERKSRRENPARARPVVKGKPESNFKRNCKFMKLTHQPL